MQRRVVFDGKVLPYLLVAPQLLVTIVFFFWPAGQAVYQSFYLQDAFGLRQNFVWFDNYRVVLTDPLCRGAAARTLVFTIAVTVLSMAPALLLAVMADKRIRGATAYKTLLIWPYAVAPAVAAVLWLFIFHPSIGVLGQAVRRWGVVWDYKLNGVQAMFLVVLAASWKQVSYNFLFFLAGLQAIQKPVIEAAAIDGAGPTRRFWSIIFPPLPPPPARAGGPAGPGLGWGRRAPAALPGLARRGELHAGVVAGERAAGQGVAGGEDDGQQLRDGDRDRGGQDRGLADLRLRGGVLQVPAPHVLLLDDLHYPDAAGGGADHPDLQGGLRPAPDQHLRRAHHSPDRVRHRDPALPPVLHDHPGRAGGGGQDRRGRAAALLPPHPAAAVPDQHRGPGCHPLPLRLEPVPVAAPHHHEQRHGHHRHRHHQDDRDRGRPDRLEPDHVHRGARHAAAGGGHPPHAAVVREGPGGDREVRGPLLLALGLVAVSAVVGSVTAAAQGMIAPLFAAHRSGELLWPENSLLAFRNALALGADFLELDVHLTRDGEVVVIHDPTLDRTTTGTGPVRARTLAELQAVRLKDREGAVLEEGIPTLDQVVALAAAV